MKRLPILFLVLTSVGACTSRTIVNQPQLRVAPALTVERFLQAANTRDLETMSRLFLEQIHGQQGFDPAFGARPLKRAIQRGIQDPLAMYLLEDEVEDGSTIRVSLVPGDALQVQFEHTHEGLEEGLLQSA